MKNNEQIVGEAVRVEFEEQTGKLFIVFEIRDEKHKLDIKKNWVKDVEFRLIDKFLVKENG